MDKTKKKKKEKVEQKLLEKCFLRLLQCMICLMSHNQKFRKNVEFQLNKKAMY